MFFSLFIREKERDSSFPPQFSLGTGVTDWFFSTSLCTKALAFAIANASLVSTLEVAKAAVMPRCGSIGITSPEKGGRNFETEEGYGVLKWAYECRGKSTQFKDEASVIDIEAAMNKANRPQATNNGTFLPNSADPRYDDVRRFVAFPVFLNADASDFWKPMFNDPETMQRIKNRDCSLEVPAEYPVVSFCPVGCFSVDSQVLFFAENEYDFQWKTISKSVETKQKVAAVEKGSTLDSLRFLPATVSYWLVDLFDAKQDLLRFSFDNGRSLKVTLGHPLVDSQGMMRSARSLKVGEKLAYYDGSSVRISDIQKTSYFGKVYNFDTEESPNYEKIVVAEGVLSGTHWYQSNNGGNINQTSLTIHLGAKIEKERAQK